MQGTDCSNKDHPTLFGRNQCLQRLIEYLAENETEDGFSFKE